SFKRPGKKLPFCPPYREKTDQAEKYQNKQSAPHIYPEQILFHKFSQCPDGKAGGYGHQQEGTVISETDIISHSLSQCFPGNPHFLQDFISFPVLIGIIPDFQEDNASRRKHQRNKHEKTQRVSHTDIAVFI